MVPHLLRNIKGKRGKQNDACGGSLIACASPVYSSMVVGTRACGLVVAAVLNQVSEV